jgi:heat shock protein HslJ
MKGWLIFTFLVLSSYTCPKPATPAWLIGDWFVIRIENLKTGTVSYGSARIRFDDNGEYSFSSCNGGGGNYSVENDVLRLEGGAHTYKLCQGWTSLIEDALGGTKNFSYVLAEHTLEVECANQYAVTFQRSSKRERNR